MSDKSLTVQGQDFSTDDVALIKQTVAKGATDSELKLFLYRCKSMGLDPLKPGQIYFIKYGSGPGTMVVGLDGFRSTASRTGKHTGTKRGSIKDEQGKLVGAWCEVYRSDWQFPAREEVSLAEYSTGKAQWLTRPETMIKKVAETATLRMAFPDELGGVYGEEELARPLDVGPHREERARETQVLIEQTSARPEYETVFQEDKPIGTTAPDDAIGSYVFKTGNTTRKGKPIQDVAVDYLRQTLEWFDEELKKGKKFSPDVEEDFFYVREYLKSLPR